MSARLQKSLLAFLGVVALARAQDVSLPVVSPTDTAINSQPTEGTLISETTETATATVTQPSFSDTVIESPVPTSTGSGDGNASGTTALTTTSTTATDTDTVTSGGTTTTEDFSASLPVITGHTTMTFTGSDGQTTTEVLNEPTDSGSGSPTTVTTMTTTTEGAGEETTTAPPAESETGGSGGGEENPDATATPGAAPRVEAAVGAGFAAFIAGLLAFTFGPSASQPVGWFEASRFNPEEARALPKKELETNDEYPRPFPEGAPFEAFPTGVDQRDAPGRLPVRYPTVGKTSPLHNNCRDEAIARCSSAFL
ncbi:hypothetical protein DL769_002582 [Monosporascus sp. CRB-8-3]|nr:hypothetical protein DL769_002582 [Monosporascus sp. CRB-8-3]